MSSIFNKIAEYGIVPLVTLNDENDAVPLAKALVKGGIPIAEVTFRTEAGAKVINKMAKEVPEILVGSGTVHTVDQVKATVDNGGKFVITPGINEKVVDYCVKNNIPVCPGVVSPSDIEIGLNYGLKVLKFFPAEAYGGIETLKALKGPYSDIKFVPTGGVGLHNLRDYLDLSNVAAVGGSFVPPSKMVANKDWNGVEKTCQDILNLVFDFSVGHVGINANTEDNANNITNQLAQLFDTKTTEGPMSLFTGNIAEIMKIPFVGQNGHICVDTADIDRAIAMFARKGVKFDESKRFCDDKGNLITAYFKDEIGGFAIHVRRRPKK